MQTLLSLLTLAGVIYLIARSHLTERKTMKEFDDLDEAVEAIDKETTALGERVDEIQQELKDAQGNPARVEAAAGKLTDVAARLRAMASPTSSGGVTVPVADQPVDGSAGAGGSSSTGATNTQTPSAPAGTEQGAGSQGASIKDVTDQG